MKLLFSILFFLMTNVSNSQSISVSTLNRFITSSVSIKEAKKLLQNSFNFISEGEVSNAGNINYQFESKDANRYTLNILYSTAFNRISYIQLYDDIKIAAIYRNQFLKLGFTYLKTNYDSDKSTQSYGYEKGNLLYVVELGVVKGQCKVHLENKDF